MQILTPNLRLVPDTLQRHTMLLDGAEVFERTTGVRVAGGLVDFFQGIALDKIAALCSACADAGWVSGFSIEHRGDNALIGFCGCKGAPDSGRAVEIGYGVAPGYRGRGLASEAVRAVVAHCFATGRIAVVRAHTLPEPNASTRVLQHCGFQKIGEVTDPEDGLVWRWETHAAAPTQTRTSRAGK
jgi:RimJ/RimL family protein N-acetyltransferase